MATPADIEARLIALEELFAHQDRRLHELNDAVLEFRGEFDRLKARLQLQIDQLGAQMEERSASYDPNEKPPHY